MIGDRLAPFKAIDGLSFFVGTTPFMLMGGAYGNGTGAIQVLAIDGQPEMKLTVNLVHAPTLGRGELFVRLHDAHDHATRILGALLALGIFIDIGTVVAQEHVEHYATKWRFAACDVDGHDAGGVYMVECPACRADLDKVFEEGKIKLLAKDAVQRIKTMGSPESW